jgi:alpha-1,6-mannosyltransferase
MTARTLLQSRALLQAPPLLQARSLLQTRTPSGGADPVTGSTFRYAQVANNLGPTTGGLGVVVQALGAEHVRLGGERLLVGPGASTGQTCTGTDLQVTIDSPALPGSGGVHRLMLARAPIVQLLNAFRPDLLEIHDQTTLAWLPARARRAGIPTVLFAHENLSLVLSEVTRLPQRMVDRFWRSWMRGMIAHVDAVVCASAFAARPFELAGAGQLVHRIALGVDLEEFRPRARREVEPPWRPGSVRLIQVARLDPEKAPDAALDALAVLRARGVPAELVMVGLGRMEPALRQRITRERLPVHLLGHITDRARVAALLAAADVALACGPRETFGLSVLEAMAAGTPVVVSDQGGCRELIEAGAGLAVAGGRAVADAVQELIGSPSARLGARRRAEQFSWAATFAAVHDLELSLLERRQWSR